MQPVRSVTVTVKLHIPVFPCEFVAEQITVVTPAGNANGELIGTLAIVQVGFRAPSHRSLAVTVKLTVAVVLPGSLTVTMLPGQVTVGVAPALNSVAPMSTWAQTLRGNPGPRWSVVRLNGSPSTVSSPASMAGLPASRAWVKVGPPLFCSGPSLGLPDTAGLQLPSWTRLCELVPITPLLL